jgi:O-antigen/teichoic acid export membrane protein
MPANRPGRRPPPTRAESFRFADGEGPRGRANGRNPEGGNRGRRPAPPTRAESFHFGDGEGPRKRPDVRNPDGRTPGRRPASTGAEFLYFRDGQWERHRTGVRAWETGELDVGLYERQTAGIAALIDLATEVAATRSRETIPSTGEGARKQTRLSVLARLRQDEMTLNSLYLVMSTGLQAGFGFVFWIMTAHLFSVSDVGKGSALISASSLIGNLSLVGLNVGMGKYLPNARNRDGLISSGLFMVAVCGAVGALLYILLTPFVAPGLAFVEKSLVLTVGFALITSATSVNTLTDVIFIASRKAKYATLVDGVIGGFGKVTLTLVLAGAGAYGLFLASAMGTVLAVIASLLLIFTAMQARLDLRRPLETLKPMLRFSGANYIGNVFNMVPGLVVPVVLLDRLGAESAAYFFVVYQIAQIVYAAAFALEQTFLAEGSRADADMAALRRRSLRLLVLFWVPTAGGIIAVGRWLLLAFGHPYYHYGYTSLIILVLAAGPISANYWFLTILRLAGKLRAIVITNATYAIGTCLFVWVGSYHGLTAVSWGWFLGAAIASCVAGVAARGGRLRPSIAERRA